MPEEHSNPRTCRLCGASSATAKFQKTGRLCQACRRARAATIAADPSTPRLQKRVSAPIWDRLLRHRKIDADGCWIWTGACDKQGYGHIANVIVDGKRRSITVHRLMAYMAHGLDLSTPNQLYACHHCDKPPCFNPEHLFCGTPQDNSNDCKQKGRERHQRGEENGGGKKLTAENVRAIRAAVNAGAVKLRIAKLYGIHHSMVSRIMQGKAWTHIA